MTKTQYGIIKAIQLQLPITRDIFRVKHKNGDLEVSYPAFGPSTYDGNLEKMQKSYFHSQEHSSISFREPTTTESISAANYDFENIAKSQIFDPRWLQLGRIVRTSQGVYVNPPRDENGDTLVDEDELKSLLDKTKEVNGIHLGENGFGFTSYEAFQQGLQDYITFCQGGLARVLEHTEEKVAEKLREIASPNFYKRKIVNVWGYDKVDQPIVRVASLGSDRNLDDGGLGVNGDDSVGGSFGFAFGVRSGAGEASVPKKN